MNDQEPARACQHCGRFEAVGNRREFLKRAGGGLGLLALAGLMDHEGVLAADSTVHSPQSAVANPLAARRFARNTQISRALSTISPSSNRATRNRTITRRRCFR